MPQLLVVTDLPESGGQVVYRERIVSSDFESTHFTGQLAERLGWAVRDAHALTGREENDDSRAAYPTKTVADAQPTEPDEAAPPGLTVQAC